MILVLDICMGILFAATGLCLWRLWVGPSLADRIVAFDTMAVNLVGIVAIASMRLQTSASFALVIVFSLLGFLGTLAIAKYYGGNDLFD